MRAFCQLLLESRRWLLVAGVVVFLSCLSVVDLYAQQTATLQGTVHDVQTGAPLKGCSIVIAGTGRGTASDASGNFEIANLPFGRFTLTASFIGYESKSLALDLNQPEVSVALRLKLQALASPPVIVLATRASERESPVTFSTITPNDLQDRYFAQDIPALLSELPSTTFYSENGNGIGYNYLSIRGFDQRRISVLINGVPQNDPEDHNVYWIDFPDLLGNTQDIQIPRCAGAAFYGPPAIGGSVNLLASNFSEEAGMEAYLGGGSLGTRKYSLALHSGWLANKFLLFGRFSRIQSDGYRERSWVDLKSYFFGAAHVSDKSISRVHFYGGPIEDHLAYYGIPKNSALQRDTRRQNPIERPDEIENFNQPQLQLLNEYRWNENWRLNNTLFAMRGDGFFDYNGNWAPLSYYRLTPEYGFEVVGNPEEVTVDSLLIRAYVDNKQIGWLPQVTWQHGRGEATIGAELRRHRSLHWGRIQTGDDALPPAVSGEYSGRNYIGVRRYYEYRGAKDIISPYVHANYRVRPSLNLNFDMQFVNLKYRLYDEEFIGTDFTLRYQFWNPRLGLNYNFGEKFNAYVSAARTSREPRLKNFYDAAEASTPASWGAVEPQFEPRPDGSFDFDQPLVHPEKLYDYEFGLGYRDDRWRVALNFYYMDFKNEIIKSGQLDRFGQPVTGNAPRTLHTGIEMQAEVKPFKWLTFGGNLTFSQNELKDYTIFTENGTSTSLSGNPIAGFPDFLANARLTFSHAGFAASLAVQHAGKRYTDNFGDRSAEILGEPRDNTVDPYTVCHGSLAYSCERLGLRGLTLQVHVQNIFDRLYIMNGEGDDFFPAAERQIFVNAKYEL
jgi:iron complex outermembrane receptor protein